MELTAMPGAFELQPSRDWKGIAQELREVLGAEEYASARASTPNAHYTSSEVIHAIWKAMERFGFQHGGHVLEPSMGVGHFFGLMPEGFYPGTRRTGVELDSITARIAAKLYPDSNVHAKALEDTGLPKDFFDAAVGNIPFGNYPVFDPAYRRTPQLTRGIHDYFLASLSVCKYCDGSECGTGSVRSKFATAFPGHGSYPLCHQTHRAVWTPNGSNARSRPPVARRA
jgi:hypothetical protein